MTDLKRNSGMADINSVDANVARLLESLVTTIGEEAQLFKNFLHHLESQQKALVERDSANLKEATTRLQQVVAVSQELENSRIDIVDEIRRLKGADEDLNIAKICNMADPNEADQLRRLRETILELYERIEVTRMRNALLVEQSMEQIHHTIETIGQIPVGHQVYHRSGGVNRERASLGLNRRV